MTSFFSAMLAAITLENVIFSRALGLNSYVLHMDSPKNIMKYGGMYTWMAFFSSMGAVWIQSLQDLYGYGVWFRSLGLLLVVLLVYVFTFGLAALLPEGGRRTVRRTLPLASLNTALFGILYLVGDKTFTVPLALGYALGSGVGYILAMLILLATRRRLAQSPIPRSFRGVPILLIFIGILSLALYGLLGYGLPL